MRIDEVELLARRLNFVLVREREVVREIEQLREAVAALRAMGGKDRVCRNLNDSIRRRRNNLRNLRRRKKELAAEVAEER